jgi:hypothetical protein
MAACRALGYQDDPDDLRLFMEAKKKVDRELDRLMKERPDGE